MRDWSRKVGRGPDIANKYPQQLIDTELKTETEIGAEARGRPWRRILQKEVASYSRRNSRQIALSDKQGWEGPENLLHRGVASLAHRETGVRPMPSTLCPSHSFSGQSIFAALGPPRAELQASRRGRALMADARRQSRQDFFELSVNSDLSAALRERLQFRFGLADSDLVADPKLPLPETRRGRASHRVFYTFVKHGISPLHRRLSLYHMSGTRHIVISRRSIDPGSTIAVGGSAAGPTPVN
jgi:hypothetical protein